MCFFPKNARFFDVLPKNVINFLDSPPNTLLDVF